MIRNNLTAFKQNLTISELVGSTAHRYIVYLYSIFPIESEYDICFFLNEKSIIKSYSILQFIPIQC